MKPRTIASFWQRQRRKVDFKPMGYKGTLRNVVRSHGGSGSAVPHGLVAALIKVRLRVAHTENRAVGFIAAQRHFTRPFWRNYFGRAEMRTLRAATGTKQATKAAALTVSRSQSNRDNLAKVSHAILSHPSYPSRTCNFA